MNIESYLDSLMLEDDQLGQLMFMVTDSASKPDGEFLYVVPAVQIENQQSLPASLHTLSNLHKQLLGAWTIVFQFNDYARIFLDEKDKEFAAYIERSITSTKVMPFSVDVGATIQTLKNRGLESQARFKKDRSFLEKVKGNFLSREEVLTLIRDCPGVGDYINCIITVSPHQKEIINQFLTQYINTYLEKSLLQQSGLLLPQKYYQPLLEMLLGLVNDRGFNNIKIDSRQSQPFCHNVLSLLELHKIKLRSFVSGTYPVAYIDNGHMTSEDGRKVAEMKPGRCWVAVLDLNPELMEIKEGKLSLPEGVEWNIDGNANNSILSFPDGVNFIFDRNSDAVAKYFSCLIANHGTVVENKDVLKELGISFRNAVRTLEKKIERQSKELQGRIELKPSGRGYRLLIHTNPVS